MNSNLSSQWSWFTPPLWTDLVKMFSRKLRHASFFSFERTDFENVIFVEKNEACLSFLENIFTKSVYRGGVPDSYLSYSWKNGSSIVGVPAPTELKAVTSAALKLYQRQ